MLKINSRYEFILDSNQFIVGQIAQIKSGVVTLRVGKKTHLVEFPFQNVKSFKKITY